ncbi:MAG: Mur ligase family protein [Myxococcales bacterium]|nr:Mur ligase family protein [Myxococcota bacterium]MDW8282736.1 Mur ligase family protein [Myxococcales bacterium]
MTYGDALTWLASLRRFGVQPGTERVGAVLARLGHPERRFAALHIAGTNGKGSTAAMCAAILLAAARAAGPDAPTVGLYTSPHLLRLTERVQLGSGPGGLLEAPPHELAEAMAQVRAEAERAPAVSLTFFEAITAAAFAWFACRGAGVVVVETGLGGRLDATRLCQAVATCITSIGLDHVEWLGPTLCDIAREKAGIFRPGVPALVACEDEAAGAVLAAEAARVGAPLLRLGLEIPLLDEELAAALALPGAHQRRNAALARALACHAPPPLGGLAARRDVQRQGFQTARWPGRLEKIPLPDQGADAWLDAAHNPEGAAALDAWLATHPARPSCVLVGILADKDAAGMLAPAARAEAAVLCRPPSPRGRPPQELAPLLQAAGYQGQPPLLCEDVATALAAARRRVPAGGMLLVYGSIFLVAEVRRLLRGEAADPYPVQDPLREARGSG